MPTTSPRPPVDADTVDLALDHARRLGVPATAWMGAAIEAALDDALISARAQRELDAWASGAATPIDELKFPTSPSVEALVLSLRPWVDDPITKPCVRAGYGVRAGQLGIEVAGSARGLWNVQPADHLRQDPESDGVRVICFRRGLPVLHGWGKDWTAAEEGVRRPRRYAATFYVAVPDPETREFRWVDADDVEGDGPAWEQVDQDVQNYLTDLVVIGRWNRNGALWVRGV